ncbi:MAG: hypothetical protein IKX90_03855 [Verrucomicrobia bacterium]|nr:hypothetical protein [Verrucomicrobiota bacterium]
MICVSVIHLCRYNLQLVQLDFLTAHWIWTHFPVFKILQVDTAMFLSFGGWEIP